jgi:hypothetical protein
MVYPAFISFSGNSPGYTDWWANFGEGMGAGGGSAGSSPSQIAVPEPATLVLLMFAVAGWYLRRSRGHIESPSNSSTRDAGQQTTPLMAHV